MIRTLSSLTVAALICTAQTVVAQENKQPAEPQAAEPSAPAEKAAQPEAVPHEETPTPQAAEAQAADAEPEPASEQPAQPLPEPAPAPPPATVQAPQPQATDNYTQLREARLAERERIRQMRIEEKRIAKESGRPLIIGGAISFGVGYVVSMTAGGILLDEGESEASFMFVPLVGNVIYLSHLIGEEQERREDDRYYDERPMFLISLLTLTPAIAQIVGVTLFTLGMVKRSKYKKKHDLAAFSITPAISPAAKGLAFSMTF